MSKGTSKICRPRVPAGPSVAVAGVPAERLRRRHDHVTGLGQRVIDRHVAEHAAHQAMVGVIAAEGGFEQLDAQGFDLVDVLGAGKPAVDAPNVPFGCPRPNLGREQGAHHRAGRRFGRQQIETAFAAPFFVPFDGIDDGLRPHPGGLARVHNGPGICQRFPVMDFELSGFRFFHRSSPSLAYNSLVGLELSSACP